MEPIIAAIGTYIPETKISNLSRLDDFGISSTFLKEKIGVFNRAIKNPEDSICDMCVFAFQDLIKQTDINTDLIDICCVVTQNPDLRIPHTSAIVLQKVGLKKNCMTFDLSQACAGYPHALSIVTSLLKTHDLNAALIFTCDPYSKIVDDNDKNTALLFGDAATATLITKKTEGYTLVDGLFGTLPGSQDCLRCEDKLYMNGREVLNNVLREVPNSIDRLLNKHQLNKEDVDLYIFHQASKYMVDSLINNLNIQSSKAPFVIENFGNTVSSSIPIVLKPYIMDFSKKFIILSGFGVGFSYGNSLIKAISV